MDYDAIIIGAGLGGCAAGSVLAGAGKKVLILERMDKVGGRCSTQEKDGFKLDFGSHVLMLAEYGSFTEALKRVNREDDVKWRHITKNLVTHSDFVLRTSAEKVTVKSNGGDIEINLRNIMAFIRKVMPPKLTFVGIKIMGRLMRLLSPAMTRVFKNFDDVSVKSFFDPIISWRQFRDILELFQFAGFGTPSWHTAVGEFMKMFLPSEYTQPGAPPVMMGYPEGGLISIPHAMCEGIKGHGGEVKTGTTVAGVIVEGGKAVGVELESGEVLNAPVIISNAGLKETVADLVGEEYFDPEYAKTVRELVTGVSAFCLRVALDEKITDMEFGFSIPVGGLEDYYRRLWDDRVIPDMPPPIMFSIPSNIDPGLAPPGKQLVIAIGALMYESNDDYFKMEPLAIESIEHALPGLKEHMIWHDFLNPDTYIVFGEKGAPAIGLAQCIGQVGDRRPSVVSPIPGLYFAGGEAGRNISGIAAEMCVHSGIACGDYILRNDRSMTLFDSGRTGVKKIFSSLLKSREV